MQIITIANLKGGIGKTTTAQALGEGLKKKGYNVLFIDLDQQKNLTTATRHNNNKNSSYELLTNEAPITECIEDNFISASENLAVIDANLSNKIGKEYKLKEALASLNKNKYDYIIIDTPPNINLITINALVCSNEVIIPTTSDLFSIDGINQLNNNIKDIKKYCNHDLKINGVLLIKYNNRSILNRQLKEQLQELCEALGTKLYKTTIRENIAIREAQTMRESIFKYAPQSNGAKDYLSFIEEFLNIELSKKLKS